MTDNEQERLVAAVAVTVIAAAAVVAEQEAKVDKRKGSYFTEWPTTLKL